MTWEPNRPLPQVQLYLYRTVTDRWKYTSSWGVNEHYQGKRTQRGLGNLLVDTCRSVGSSSADSPNAGLCTVRPTGCAVDVGATATGEIGTTRDRSGYGDRTGACTAR